MTTQPRVPDPSLLRGATMPRMSRRDLFRAAGVGAGALSLSAILAACGVQASSAGGSGSPTGADQPGSPEWWAAKKAEDLAGTNVNFTNWPQYLDIAKVDGVRVHPTLEAFTDATQIDVTYRADINDITEFYATIQPQMSAHQDTGHDIIVITNGPELSEMLDLGYVTPLDPDLMPNFQKYADPTVRDPSYDPGNAHSMAWQSGFTGMAWNTKYIDKEITSFMDLFDPAYAGHIGMIGNNVDLPAMAMMAVGVTPETSTPEDWQRAADLLQQQKDANVIRNYYTQNYLTAFENEDIWISMAWSGDILIDQLYYGREEFRFIIPEEGGVIWTDNMLIPMYSQNPVGAMKLMDWYYQPEIAAQLTEYNNYVGRSRTPGRSWKRTPRPRPAMTRPFSRRWRAARSCSRPRRSRPRCTGTGSSSRRKRPSGTTCSFRSRG